VLRDRCVDVESERIPPIERSEGAELSRSHAGARLLPGSKRVDARSTG
jgi:hypothetical protein